MDRITVPLVSETGELIEPRYFSYLLERAKKIDKAVEIIPSGGVVRSAISYIYDEMRKGKSLADLAADKTLIPAADFRSIGGDFDVFARSPNGKMPEVAKLIKDITNSAEEKYGMTESRAKVKRQFFTIADVKDFDEHWQRSVSQGGSTLDFLGFHYFEDGGSFLEPPQDTNIVRNLIRGRFRYIAGDVSAEDLAKQVVRGFRALVELPWLRLADERVLADEVDQVIAKARSGERGSSKVIEQFAKLVRNSRYHGANNRFYRAAAGSVEGRLVELSAVLSDPKKPLLPEFLQAMPAGREPLPSPDLNYMTYDDFIRGHTNNGVLHHGTPMLEHGMAILRNGLFVSAEVQGTSAKGYGTYTSADPNFARGYAGSDGLVLELRIKPEAKIIDWKKFKASNAILFAEIEAEAAAKGIDPKRLFSQSFDVDVIIDGHVLIQNAEMVEYPDGMKSLLKSIRDQAMDASRGALQRLRASAEFKRSQAFLSDLGMDVDDIEIDERRIFRDAVEELEGQSIYNIRRYREGRLIEAIADFWGALPESQRANFPLPKNLDAMMERFGAMALQAQKPGDFNIRNLLQLQARLAAAGIDPKPISYGSLMGQLAGRVTGMIWDEKKAKADLERIGAILDYISDHYPGKLDEAIEKAANFFHRSVSRNSGLKVQHGRTLAFSGLPEEVMAKFVDKVFSKPPHIMGLGSVGSVLLAHPSLVNRPGVVGFIDDFIEKTGTYGQQVAMEYLLVSGDAASFQRMVKLVDAGLITEKSFPSGGTNYPKGVRLKLVQFLIENRRPELWMRLKLEMHQYITELKEEIDPRVRSLIDELAMKGTREERAFGHSIRFKLLDEAGQRESIQALLAMKPPLIKEDLRFLVSNFAGIPIGAAAQEFVEESLDAATAIDGNRVLLFDKLAPSRHSVAKTDLMPRYEKFFLRALASKDETAVAYALDNLERLDSERAVDAIMRFQSAGLSAELRRKHESAVAGIAVQTMKDPGKRAAALAVLESGDMDPALRERFKRQIEHGVRSVETGRTRFRNPAAEDACFEFYQRAGQIMREQELAEQLLKGSSR